MTLSRQFQASLFFFTKRFWANKKHQSAKQTTFTLLEVLCAKNCCLCYFLLACFCFLDGFGLICVFVRSKSFCKKKKKKLAWNYLDSLIYYTTDVYPPQLAYRESICTHLFLFVIICKNLFYLWESLLIYDHLCESMFLWKKASVNLLSSKHDNILLISHVPSLCFSLWIFFILCWILFD